MIAERGGGKKKIFNVIYIIYTIQIPGCTVVLYEFSMSTVVLLLFCSVRWPPCLWRGGGAPPLAATLPPAASGPAGQPQSSPHRAAPDTHNEDKLVILLLTLFSSVRIRIQGPSGFGSGFTESGSRGLKIYLKCLINTK